MLALHIFLLTSITCISTNTSSTAIAFTISTSTSFHNRVRIPQLQFHSKHTQLINNNNQYYYKSNLLLRQFAFPRSDNSDPIAARERMRQARRDYEAKLLREEMEWSNDMNVDVEEEVVMVVEVDENPEINESEIIMTDDEEEEELYSEVPDMMVESMSYGTSVALGAISDSVVDILEVESHATIEVEEKEEDNHTALMLEQMEITEIADDTIETIEEQDDNIMKVVEEEEDTQSETVYDEYKSSSEVINAMSETESFSLDAIGENSSEVEEYEEIIEIEEDGTELAITMLEEAEIVPIVDDTIAIVEEQDDNIMKVNLEEEDTESKTISEKDAFISNLTGMMIGSLKSEAENLSSDVMDNSEIPLNETKVTSVTDDTFELMRDTNEDSLNEGEQKLLISTRFDMEAKLQKTLASTAAIQKEKNDVNTRRIMMAARFENEAKMREKADAETIAYSMLNDQLVPFQDDNTALLHDDQNVPIGQNDAYDTENDQSISSEQLATVNVEDDQSITFDSNTAKSLLITPQQASIEQEDTQQLSTRSISSNIIESGTGTVLNIDLYSNNDQNETLSLESNQREVTEVESPIALESYQDILTEDISIMSEYNGMDTSVEHENEFLSKLKLKMGKVSEDRLMFGVNNEDTRLFSNVKYESTRDDITGVTGMLTTSREVGSVFGAGALIAGTTIGAGVLALPAATAPVGFIPSSFAMLLGWAYMAASALIIAELAINRIAETGRPGVGLLDMQRAYLPSGAAALGGLAYFFLHYAVMVAYMAQGGTDLGYILDAVGLEGTTSIPGLDQVMFAGIIGSAIYFFKPSTMENINNILVGGVITTFVGLVGLGLPSVDFNALIAPENQNPVLFLDTLPIIYLSMVYHNVVPTVVTQLEGDAKKIRTAIVGGSFVPLIMYFAWNTVILGNVLGSPEAVDGVISGELDPVALLQSGGNGGALLSTLVGTFSALAVVTSLIGFVYGMQDGIRDVFQIPKDGPEYEKWKPALFLGALLPPVILSSGNPDIFMTALDYGGAFGVSTLFLLLPPFMAWKVRYEDETRKVATLPLLPGGKITLASLWKAAGTLIVEQGLDKLGVFDFLHDRWAELTSPL